MNETLKRILNLIADNYKTEKDFEQEFHLPIRCVSNWKRNLSSSYMFILPEIAQRFSVTVNYLLAIDTTKISLPNATDNAIFQVLESCSNDVKNQVLNFARFLREQEHSK